eukprot:GFUD01001731.1.p1 GENE.GFUD01001731.1~~GFUD01001731.1.p1  ORF type:complete len:431 (+),score=142.20 GFUD01001731.1:82-1374(+)
MSGFSFITQLLNKSIAKVKDDFSNEEPTVKRKLEETSEEEIEIPVKKKKKKRVKDNIEYEPENETSPAKQKKKSRKRDLEENQSIVEPDGLSLEDELSLIKKKKKKHKKCKEEEAEIRLQEGIVSKDSDDLCMEEAEELSLRKKKKKKHKKCKKEEEIRLQEGIVNQDSVELCVEEAGDLSSQKKKKHKKRKEEEEKIRAQGGIVNNAVVSAKTQQEKKDKNKNEDIENQVDKIRVNNSTAKKQEYTSGPVYKMKQKKRCWTLEEDQILVEKVLRDKNGGKFLRVEQCVEARVDWDSIGEYFTEYGRTKQLVRERWTRTVKTMLLENEQDPEEIYEYQRNLIQHVMDMGITDRKKIRWNEIAKVFDPKTSSALSQDFWGLIRHRKNETLSGKLSAALECLENPMKQSVSANIKKNETKSQLLDFYYSLVK